MDIERFSDLIKPRTSTTRDSIDQILQLTANNFPQELIKGWKSMICKNIVVFIRIILEIHLMVQWNFRFKGTTEHKKSAMEYRCRFDEIKCVSSISFSFLFIWFCFKKVYLYVICPIHLYWLGKNWDLKLSFVQEPFDLLYKLYPWQDRYWKSAKSSGDFVSQLLILNTLLSKLINKNNSH